MHTNGTNGAGTFLVVGGQKDFVTNKFSQKITNLTGFVMKEHWEWAKPGKSLPQVELVVFLTDMLNHSTFDNVVKMARQSGIKYLKLARKASVMQAQIQDQLKSQGVTVVDRVKLFGERLRNARLKAGISQTQLSDKLKISSPSLLGYYENGKGVPTIKNYNLLVGEFPDLGKEPRPQIKSGVGPKSPYCEFDHNGFAVDPRKLAKVIVVEPPAPVIIPEPVITPRYTREDFTQAIDQVAKDYVYALGEYDRALATRDNLRRQLQMAEESLAVAESVRSDAESKLRECVK